jgi:hypothetical protein
MIGPHQRPLLIKRIKDMLPLQTSVTPDTCTDPLAAEMLLTQQSAAEQDCPTIDRCNTHYNNVLTGCADHTHYHTHFNASTAGTLVRTALSYAEQKGCTQQATTHLLGSCVRCPTHKLPRSLAGCHCMSQFGRSPPLAGPPADLAA